MSQLILYGNRESGHAYKARLLLSLTATPHEYRPIDLRLPRDQRPAEFRKVSRFGEVPVLVDHGVALCQSNAILLHLARRIGRFGAADDAGWDQIQEWLCWEMNRIGFSVPNLRAARIFAPDTPAPVITWIEARAVADLDRLDAHLNGGDFILGAAPTIADLSCCGYLFWPEQAGLDLARWPTVTRWLDRVRALPGWQHPYEMTEPA
jgi:glutathione S-transferase